MSSRQRAGLERRGYQNRTYTLRQMGLTDDKAASLWNSSMISV
ncbi:MAG: hypothetical protein ACLR0N_03665 [Bilophila wadsworthia]